MTHNIFVVAWNNLMSILSLNNGDSTTTMDKIYHKPDLLSSIKSHPSSKIVAYRTPSKYIYLGTLLVFLNFLMA